MGYSKEERETVLVYTYDEKLDEWVWLVDSTVPKHIRKLMKIGDMDVLESENDNVVAIKGKLNEKQVSLRQIRELTEEQRKQKSDQMKRNLTKMKKF